VVGGGAVLCVIPFASSFILPSSPFCQQCSSLPSPSLRNGYLVPPPCILILLLCFFSFHFRTPARLLRPKVSPSSRSGLGTCGHEEHRKPAHHKQSQTGPPQQSQTGPPQQFGLIWLSQSLEHCRLTEIQMFHVAVAKFVDPGLHCLPRISQRCWRPEGGVGFSFVCRLCRLMTLSALR
jgi:hypothetical protein